MSKVVYRIGRVLQATALSRSSMYELMRRGEFPRSIALGSRAVGWLESEIDAWIASRPKAGASVDSSGAKEVL